MRQMLRISAACLIIMIVCVAVGTSADAQQYTSGRPGSRSGTWDFYLPLTYAESTTINGQGGSSVDVNAGWGVGFGLGYNFTEHFQLNGLWTWNSRSYDARIVNISPPPGAPTRYSNWMDTSTLSLNGTYYFLNGAITPFVSGGIGITYIDTNIQTGYSGPAYCWWDPWWGYVCSSYAPTKTENDFSYNAGVGIRADLDRQFALQFSYSKTWIDVSKASGIPDFDVWRLDFVFRM